MITKRELVQDTIAMHGHRWTAERYAKRMPFTLYYWLAFGRAPRPRVAAPRSHWTLDAMYNSAAAVGQAYAAAQRRALAS